MKTSLVTPNTAGIESTANTTSVASMTTSTISSGVAKSLPSWRVKKCVPTYSGVTRTKRRNSAQHRVLLRVRLLVAAAHQAHRGEDQERAEDVHDEVEVREQRGADGDEEAARDQRADDSPEQHAVLQVRGHREVRERHQEHEQVVDGQRLLDQPGLEELQRAIGAAVKVDAEVEQQRHADPDRRPDRRLARADDVRLAVKHAEVQRQHDEHDSAEHHPRHRLPRDHRGLTSRR